MRGEQRLIDALLKTQEPKLRAAFLDALRDLRSGVVLRVVVENLERGDINGAVAALGLDADAFGRFEAAMLDAYSAGGQAVVGNLPRVRDPDGNLISFRWGVRNLPAEQELRRHAATLVDDILDDTRDGLRDVLTDGLSRGDNPWTTARRIVGPRSRVTGNREGGYLGMTGPQMRTVDRYRQALKEGDTEAMRAFLDLKLRDRRGQFSKPVTDALRDGTAVDLKAADAIMDRYASRAVDYRARVVSRQETMRALEKSKHDAYRQQIDSGKLDAADVTKTWRFTPQRNNRDQHVMMNGQAVRFDQPFIAPDGTPLRYPLDENAPARHTIGCKCYLSLEIDFAGAALRRYRERTAA